MLERGHQVHFLGDPTLEEAAGVAGCTFSPWVRAPHRTSLDPSEDPIKDWESRNPLVLLQRARDRLIAGPADRFAADTAATIDAVRPDVVVPDAFLFGSIIAAQAAALPVAVLVPNLWIMPTPGTTPVGPGFRPAATVVGRTRDAAARGLINRLFDRGLPALNSARTAAGLAPLASFYDQALSADAILVLTSPAFDTAAQVVPANAHYVGAILDDPEWAEPWTSPWPDTDSTPLVLVGFSSTYQNQGPLLRRVVEALSGLPVHAVVTVGRMLDGGEVAASDNVSVVRSAPHREILRRASLTISHCGHGTTIKTLAAGVPMVCIPMGRDQNDTAARIVHHGAGLRLPMGASVPRIRQTVQRLLADGRFRRCASRLAAAMAADDPATGLATHLEPLMAGREIDDAASS
jgi:MGT family glycosyltransferase